MAQVNTMEDSNIMEYVYTTATNPVNPVEEDAAHKTTGIGVEAVVVEPTEILHITVGHTECVAIRKILQEPSRWPPKGCGMV